MVRKGVQSPISEAALGLAAPGDAVLAWLLGARPADVVASEGFEHPANNSTKAVTVAVAV